MRKIITISREFGAYGGTIGLKVSEKLGYEFYNKEIILQAAKYSNVDMDSLQKWDEKVPVNFGFAQSLFDFYNKPLNEKLFAAQKKVIREIGEKGNCVIVGRFCENLIMPSISSSMRNLIFGLCTSRRKCRIHRKQRLLSGCGQWTRHEENIVLIIPIQSLA